MSTFEDNVSLIAAQREEPVAAVKARLKPVRTELLADREIFLKRDHAARPALEAAQRKLMKASSVGVESATLRHHVAQAFGDGGVSPGLLVGALNGYDDAVRQIDSLSVLQLARDPYLETRLRGAPERLRGCQRALDVLLEDVGYAVSALERLLSERAASGSPPAILTATPAADAPAGPVVESTPSPLSPPEL